MHDLTDDIAKTLNVPMVTRWMLVAEVIDGDGDTQIQEVASPGLPIWQRWGLLSWAAQGYGPQPGWTIDYGGPAYEGGEDD